MVHTGNRPICDCLYAPYIFLYGAYRQSSDLREVLAEGPARRSDRRSQAHDVAKSILYVLEPRVACVGHRSTEQLELRRSSC